MQSFFNTDRSGLKHFPLLWSALEGDRGGRDFGNLIQEPTSENSGGIGQCVDGDQGTSCAARKREGEVESVVVEKKGGQ